MARVSGGAAWWFKRHQHKEPCECEAEAETIRRQTGYSDSLYGLRECPECGAKWTFWMEG